MGCDIHAHFEIKINNNWEHYSVPKIERNYELFSKMANVRNTSPFITPISEPKGLPKNLSTITKLEALWWEGDAHSHSWLNAAEIEKIMDFHRKQHKNTHYLICREEWGYLYGNGWDNFNQSRKGYPPEIEDIRLIFWFDN